MKNCPHCEFLVADGATECGVCHQPVGLPPQPPGEWGLEPAPPAGAGGAAPWAPVTSGEQQQGPATGAPAWVPPTPVAPTSAGRPAVIIGLSIALGLAVLILMALVAVTFIGRKVEPSAGSPLSAAPPVVWKAYKDPEGRFGVDMPGSPSVRNRQEQAGLSAPAQIVVAKVLRPSWDSVVMLIDLPPDHGQIDVSPRAQMNRFFTGLNDDSTVKDVAVGAAKDVTLPSGPALDVRYTRTGGSGPLVGFARFITVGSDCYTLVTVGPLAQESTVRDAQDRMVASFTVPAKA